MPADPTTLRALAARAEAGETGRAFDRDIARALGWHRVEPRFASSKNGGWIAPEDFLGAQADGRPILDSLHGTEMHRDVPLFSASLDAQEAVGPTIVRVQVYPNSVGAWAVLETNLQVSRAHAPTEKLARIAAKLYALAAAAERAP